MKFGKYLASKQRPEWTTNYLDYKALKDVIKQAVDEVQSDGIEGSSPRETSLTVLRSGRVDRAEDRFFILIEKEVRCRPLGAVFLVGRRIRFARQTGVRHVIFH